MLKYLSAYLKDLKRFSQYRFSQYFYSRIDVPGYRLPLLFTVYINTNTRSKTNNTRDTSKDGGPGNKGAEGAPTGKFPHIKHKRLNLWTCVNGHKIIMKLLVGADEVFETKNGYVLRLMKHVGNVQKPITFLSHSVLLPISC